MATLEHADWTRSAPAASRWRPTPARLAELVLGLWLFGTGEALLVASNLGNSPWTVLAQGLARQAGIAVGTATILVSIAVLLAWLPLRQAPGLGTLANAIGIGLAISVTLAVVPSHPPTATRAAFVPCGIALVMVGSGFYLAARLGPGPRDGLMTGIHRRTGLSLRVARAMIEVSAVACGYALGGVVGIGTVAFALTIGPGVQLFVHRLDGRDTTSL